MADIDIQLGTLTPDEARIFLTALLESLTIAGGHVYREKGPDALRQLEQECLDAVADEAAGIVRLVFDTVRQQH